MGLNIESGPDRQFDRGIQIANIILEKVTHGALMPSEVKTITRILIAAGFSPDEPLNTSGMASSTARRQIIAGNTILEPTNKILRLPDGRIMNDLPLKEMSVLEALMLNSPNALTRRQIMGYAEINENADERVVDVYVNSLRRVIETQRPPRHLLTVRGIGYAFKG